MPTAFAAEVLRRPIILIAAWLIVVQAFLAGLATAQAAAMFAPAPFEGGVICHGAGGPGSTEPSAPDADKVWKLCCASCATASPAAVPLEAPDVAPVVSRERMRLRALTSFTVIIARGAVRAGPSQAPPHLA